MKKITLVILASLSALNISHANIQQIGLARWCAVDANGQVPSGCIAPALTSSNIGFFTHEYNLLQSPLQSNNSSPEVVPFVGSSTENTVSNMVPSTIAQGAGLQFAPVMADWQYVFKVVYFGGSESEGQVQLPPPNFLRTAHRNNAKVLGSIFFSPTMYGGSLEQSQLANFLNDSTATAQTLSKIAQSYGVDGFFFNEEDPYPNGISVNNAINMMQSYNQNISSAGISSDMEWYFVADVDGNNNSQTLINNNQQITDSTFVDYGLNQGIPNEIPQAYPKQDVEYGFDPDITWMSLQSSLSSAKQDQVSFGVFAFSHYLTNIENASGNAGADFSQELGFWQAASAAGYTAGNTPAYPQNFSTNFNVGEGFTDFYINGMAQNFGQWSDIGLQDYLPLINTTQDFSSQWNFQNAFDGGSSLNVAVNGATTDSLLLYQGLNTPVNNNTSLAVTYQPVGSQSDYQLCLTTSIGASKCYALDNNPTATVSNWYKKTWVINGDLKGTITSISLKNVRNTAEQINIAQIYVGDAVELNNAPQAPSNVNAQAPIQDNGSPDYYHHIVSWNAVTVANDNNVHYRLFAGANFLGETTQTSFDIVNQNAQNAAVCVEAVNGAGLASACEQAQ